MSLADWLISDFGVFSFLLYYDSYLQNTLGPIRPVLVETLSLFSRSTEKYKVLQ